MFERDCRRRCVVCRPPGQRERRALAAQPIAAELSRKRKLIHRNSLARANVAWLPNMGSRREPLHEATRSASRARPGRPVLVIRVKWHAVPQCCGASLASPVSSGSMKPGISPIVAHALSCPIQRRRLNSVWSCRHPDCAALAVDTRDATVDVASRSSLEACVFSHVPQWPCLA